MTFRLEWYLERAVHFERPDRLTVDNDVERATTDFQSDRLMRQLSALLPSLISFS